MTINLNNSVEIELTEVGRDVWKKYHDDWRIPEAHRQPLPPSGLMNMPLWKVMKIFGPWIIGDAPRPIKDSIEYLNEEVA